MTLLYYYRVYLTSHYLKLCRICTDDDLKVLNTFKNTACLFHFEVLGNKAIDSDIIDRFKTQYIVRIFLVVFTCVFTFVFYVHCFYVNILCEFLWPVCRYFWRQYMRQPK